MNPIQPCMGGWCSKRGHCANYHAADSSLEPEERLCPPGQYGTYLAINLHKVEQPKPQGEITPTRAQQ